MKNVSALQPLWPIILLWPICRHWCWCWSCSRCRYRLGVAYSCGRRWRYDHILPTDDTRLIRHQLHLGKGHIRTVDIHAFCSGAVPDNVPYPNEKVATGDVHVTNGVKGNAVEGEDKGEEDEVDDELDKVYWCISLQRVATLT